MKRLNMLIQQFWAWSGHTQESYAGQEFLSLKYDGFEECDFPEYGELADEAIELLREDGLNCEDMDDFLTAMAINAESGWVCDSCIEDASDSFYMQVITQGYRHLQPETRWQIAKMLQHRKVDGGRNILSVLQNDPCEYVRRCARFAISSYIT